MKNFIFVCFLRELLRFLFVAVNELVGRVWFCLCCCCFAFLKNRRICSVVLRKHYKRFLLPLSFDTEVQDKEETMIYVISSEAEIIPALCQTNSIHAVWVSSFNSSLKCFLLKECTAESFTWPRPLQLFYSVELFS